MMYSPISRSSSNNSVLKFKFPAVEQEAHLFFIGRTASDLVRTSNLSAHSSTRDLNSSLSRHALMAGSSFLEDLIGTQRSQ